jgi:hypothetical protein
MKRLLKLIGWSLLGALGVLVLAVAAWIASNWHDIEPQPAPAALALPTPQLSDAENSFEALQQIHAGFEAPKNGARMRCDARSADCYAQWSQDLVALRAARQAYTRHGERCDALLREKFEFEERVPTPKGLDVVLPTYQGLSTCADWWLSGAALAVGEKNAVQALALLMQADRYHRALQGGMHSLIGQMVALSVSRKTVQTLMAVALREPGLAQATLPLVAPFPDPAAAARRWMVVEAAFQRSWMQSIGQTPYRTPPEEASVLSPLAEWFANRRLGFHPNRTSHDNDARWLRWISQLEGGLPAAARSLAQEAEATHSQGWIPGLTWRNPVGNIIMSVATPAFASYIASQADLDLHRELAQLAITAQIAGIAPAQRAAWSKMQPLSADTAARLSWSADGQVLSAKTWEAEVSASAAQNPERQAIRIEWPSAQNIKN